MMIDEYPTLAHPVSGRAAYPRHWSEDEGRIVYATPRGERFQIHPEEALAARDRDRVRDGVMAGARHLLTRITQTE